MVITRIKGETYNEDLIFAIDYKNSYNEISKYEFLKQQKCVIDILRLVTEDKRLLSRFLERDKHLDPDKKDMCREFLNDYHKGRQSDFDGCFERKIKKILLKYEKLNSNNVDNIEEVKDRLFNKFKNTPLGDMNKNMLDEIKEVLYDGIYVCCLEDYNKDVQKFVKERTFEITNNFWFPYNENVRGIDFDKSYTRDLWIDLSLKDDLDYWFKNILGGDFEGVIIDKSNVQNYDYYLSYCANDWIGDIELSVLTVLERNKGDFIKNMFSLLEKELGFEIKPVDDISKILE